MGPFWGKVHCEKFGIFLLKKNPICDLQTVACNSLLPDCNINYLYGIIQKHLILVYSVRVNLF